RSRGRTLRLYDHRAPAQDSGAGLVVFERRHECIAADSELVPLAQQDSHPGTQWPTIVQGRAGGAYILDPIALVAEKDLGLYPRNQALGIRQGKGGVVRATERAPPFIEPANQGLAQGLVVQFDALQDKGHGLRVTSSFSTVRRSTALTTRCSS